MSEMLKKARAYEAEKAAQTDKNTRPLFHILQICFMHIVQTPFGIRRLCDIQDRKSVV